MLETRFLPTLPRRIADTHKGDYGRVLVLAGRQGMAGAAALCGQAALRGGAGLVTVACPATVQPTVAATYPCYTTLPLPDDNNGEITTEAITPLRKQVCDVLALGPGLGTGTGATFVLRSLLAETSTPAVVDADGLNCLSPYELKRGAPTILTPHPGEFARLTGQPAPREHESRIAAAGDFALRFRLVVLLKGHRTVVSDGERYYANRTGNPGMATGGSGDVLTGLIAGLVGQKLDVFSAACLAVHLHGLAGDFAARQLGEVSLTAMDILHALPAAFQSL